MENCDLDLWRVPKLFNRLSSLDIGNAEFLVFFGKFLRVIYGALDSTRTVVPAGWRGPLNSH